MDAYQQKIILTDQIHEKKTVIFLKLNLSYLGVRT